MRPRTLFIALLFFSMAAAQVGHALTRPTENAAAVERPKTDAGERESAGEGERAPVLQSGKAAMTERTTYVRVSINASPVVALNRAVALAKVHGPAAALATVAALEHDPKLRHYHLLLAVRGQLLLDLGRGREAADAFRAALTCACTEPERRLLRRRLEACAGQ
jgi:hypothetical protein